jgi:polyisoprenoid-binding protein YceI
MRQKDIFTNCPNRRLSHTQVMTTRPIARLILASIVTIGLAQQTARANCRTPAEIATASDAHATLADSVTAGQWTALTFDGAQTTIAYKLIGWPHVTDGTFKLKSGVIRVDAVSGKMAGEIVVDAASGDSGHSGRDARMKDSILEAASYPEISYAPQQVESHGVPRGEFPVVVRGVMTLHGEPHPFTVTAIVARRGDDATIHCHFAIPDVAWGLEDRSILFFKVEPNVSVEVTAIAHIVDARPAALLGGESFLTRDDAAAQRIGSEFP